MNTSAIVPYSWEMPAFSPSVTLSGGLLNFSEPVSAQEDNQPGMKLVLVLSGSLNYQLPGGAFVCVQGPALHLALSEAPFSIQHRFDDPDPLHYITVRMPLENLADQFDTDLPFLARRPHTGCGGRQSQLIIDSRAGEAVQTLGRQMLLCRLQGGMRNLYLSGKALELTATVMDGLQHPHAPQAAPLNTRDSERLQQARELLLAQLQTPPTLPELARQIGINVSKLTSGFRQLFGCSVYAFVREQRLQLAYRMLADGAISVADAAHACGYTDSHFTKVFRSRFGSAPSSLRR